MMPPSRQDDGNGRAPALSRAVCVVVQVVAVGRARWWSVKVVCLPAHLLDRLLWRGHRATSQTPPVSWYAALLTVVALASGSALRGNSRRSRVDGFSGISSSFHAGSLVTMRLVKYDVSSLMDSSARVCTAIQYSVLAGTTEVKLLF